MALADVANPDLYLGALQAGGGYAIWGVVLGFQAMQHFARAAQTRQINALRCLLQVVSARAGWHVVACMPGCCGLCRKLLS